MVAYVLSFAAGTLTVISPCILPALPIIVGSATQESKKGPLFIAAGMIISFTATGIFLSTIGMALGIDRALVRLTAAALIFLMGVTLLLPFLQNCLASVLVPLSRWASKSLEKKKISGPWGHLLLGALLGAVWSPCSGPTLGAALGLASQKQELLAAAAMMFLFGVGSAVPLLAIAYGSREFFQIRKTKILKLGQWAKPVFGAILVAVGISIFFGIDKSVEAALLKTLPQSWLRVMTSF